MKKTIILLSITAILISSCSAIKDFMMADPTPVPPTPEETAISDPCAPENLLEEVEKVLDLVNKFQDLRYLSNFTPTNQMTILIMEMQNVRRELQKLEVPVCEEAIKTASLNYMRTTFNYLAFFMANPIDPNDPTQSHPTVIVGIQNSDVLWETVLGEFNNLLTSAGLASEELPDISESADPAATTETGITEPADTTTTTDTGVIIGNEGVQAVNIRSQPNIDAEIVSRLEPGLRAIGISRNTAGDWLLVNLDGVIGWVYTEMITSSTPVEELPISDPAAEPAQ